MKSNNAPKQNTNTNKNKCKTAAIIFADRQVKDEWEESELTSPSQGIPFFSS